MQKSYQTTSFKLMIILIISIAVRSVPYTNFLSAKGMLDKINEFRANPSAAASRIKAIWKDNMQGCLQTKWRLQMNECQRAIDEAINVLPNTPACPPLQLNQATTRVSWEHSKYLVEENGQQIGHTGGPGRSGLSDRWNIYNNGSFRAIAENVLAADENMWSTDEIVVLAFIIDDGTSSRGHRKNLFNCQYRHVGLGLYPFKSSRRGTKSDMVTQMFSAEPGTCKGCSSWSKTINDQICWTNFNAGSNTCDPDRLSGGGNGGNNRPVQAPTPVQPVEPAEPTQPVQPTRPTTTSQSSNSNNKPKNNSESKPCVPPTDMWSMIFNNPCAEASNGGNSNNNSWGTPSNNGNNNSWSNSWGNDDTPSMCPNNCSGNGSCDYGFCKCKKGFKGVSCNKRSNGGCNW